MVSIESFRIGGSSLTASTICVRPLPGRNHRAHAGPTGTTLGAWRVLLASSLRKEFSGDPLFDGVSFKLERGDRLALAGPNGAGKTTLLRALMGETELAGGELAWEKGARVALHDQRPPRLGGFTLREYALSGASDLIEAERELRRLEEAMAAAITRRDAPALRRGAGAARARGRLRLARPRHRRRTRPRLHGRRLRPRARDLLRRGADSRLARARARGRSGSAPPRRADQPPRHGLDGVARAGARHDRRRGRPRRPRSLVPRGGRDVRAGARRRPLRLLPRQVARVAAGEGRAARQPGEWAERQAEDIARSIGSSPASATERSRGRRRRS